MNEELKTIEINDFNVSVFEPEGEEPLTVTLLIHGWTGDENSMWIFASKLEKNSLMIAPRGLHPSNHAELGGYSWVEKPSGRWSWLDDFAPSIGALNDLLEVLAGLYPRADFSKIRIAGFSQGAALSYAFTLLHPHRVSKLAGLAGFLPENSESVVSTSPMKGIPVFITHGTKDEIVPIEMAYQARKLLTQTGANVYFCESETGHKLGGSCFRSFQDFMDND